MKIPISVLFLLLMSLGAAAQEDWKALITKTGTEYSVEGAEKVDAPRALELMEAGETFVDVRRSIQFNLAHIPGAINLDINSALNQQSLSEHVAKDQMVVFYCSDFGCDRSARASAMAVSWGYESVVYFAGGWSTWIAKNYPRN